MMQRFKRPNLFIAVCVSSLAISFSGCTGDTTEDSTQVIKPAKPVSTIGLKKGSPSVQHHTTAAVAPWKAERIAFEQPGRVVQVIEPNEMVTARGHRGDGVPLARLDDEQFQIAVEAATADAAVAERRRDANLIAIEQRIPTLIKTAESELELAESELARAERLSNSISKSEFDTARTRASTARLQVASAKSELAQANAEQLALDAQVQQANQRIAEAQRNLKNTVLFSSFPGQVAEIHAVPGTFVKEGDPIVTVQMVDPMLVEFEVTAANSRRYQRGDTLAVSVTTHDGQRRKVTGMVYTVDTIADTNTKTFTVALHVRNQQVTENSVDTTTGEPGNSAVIARTKNIFPLNIGPIVTGDQRLLVEQSCIHQIGNESFVWKITNRAWDQLSNAQNRELVVQRSKVSVTSDVISFLGTWNFVAIEFEDATSIDLDQDLITGKLYFADHDETDQASMLADWNGDRVLLEQTRWMLRAGDTVRVAMIPETSATGFYLPMKAVRRENDITFIHVIDDSQPEKIARRVTVNVTSEHSVADESLMLQIEPLSVDLQEGTQVIVGGTHYLNDGDRVRIVALKRKSEGGR